MSYFSRARPRFGGNCLKNAARSYYPAASWQRPPPYWQRGGDYYQRGAPVQRDTRALYAPKSDDAIGRFLMSWRNVQSSRFLQSLRASYLKYGRLSDKQKTALGNAYYSQRRRNRLTPRTFPSGESADPLQIRLTTLTSHEIEQLEDERFQQTIASIQKQLLEKSFLTWKQLKAVGSALAQIDAKLAANRTADPKSFEQGKFSHGKFFHEDDAASKQTGKFVHESADGKFSHESADMPPMEDGKFLHESPGEMPQMEEGKFLHEAAAMEQGKFKHESAEEKGKFAFVPTDKH